MRIMYDAIYATNLPPGGADLYAGYDDGHWPDAAAIAARFPDKTVVQITVFPTDNEGDVLDVETGDATPAQAPAWVTRRRAAGHTWPTVYCSSGMWSTVQAAFRTQNVPAPYYWIAAYPGIGPVLYPGSVAHQYADAGNYDISVVADNWPPAVAPPAPPPAPPTHYPEDNVTSYPTTVRLAGGKGWIPSPVPAAKVISVVVETENPDVVGRYDSVPTVWSVAVQPGSHSPNGALVIEGMAADGNYGVVVWAAG